MSLSEALRTVNPTHGLEPGAQSLPERPPSGPLSDEVPVARLGDGPPENGTGRNREPGRDLSPGCRERGERRGLQPPADTPCPTPLRRRRRGGGNERARRTGERCDQFVQGPAVEPAIERRLEKEEPRTDVAAKRRAEPPLRKKSGRFETSDARPTQHESEPAQECVGTSGGAERAQSRRFPGWSADGRRKHAVAHRRVDRAGRAGSGSREQLFKLVPNAFGGDARQTRGARADEGARRGFDGRRKLSREPIRTEEPKRIVVEIFGPDGPNHAADEIAPSAERIEEESGREIPSHCVHGEVPAPEISGKAAGTAESGDIHDSRRTGHPPDGNSMARAGDPKRLSPAPAGESAGQRFLAVRNRQIDVAPLRPPAETVSNDSADEIDRPSRAFPRGDRVAPQPGEREGACHARIMFRRWRRHGYNDVMKDRAEPSNPFLTPGGVARIAALARLDLSPEELATLAPQMEKIARHVEKIREIPEELLPPAEDSPATPFREDLPVVADGYAELVANSDSLTHRHVAVPRVVE